LLVLEFLSRSDAEYARPDDVQTGAEQAPARSCNRKLSLLPKVARENHSTHIGNEERESPEAIMRSALRSNAGLIDGRREDRHAHIARARGPPRRLSSAMNAYRPAQNALKCALHMVLDCVAMRLALPTGELRAVVRDDQF